MLSILAARRTSPLTYIPPLATYQYRARCVCLGPENVSFTVLLPPFVGAAQGGALWRLPPEQRGSAPVSPATASVLDLSSLFLSRTAAHCRPFAARTATVEGSRTMSRMKYERDHVGFGHLTVRTALLGAFQSS